MTADEWARDVACTLEGTTYSGGPKECLDTTCGVLRPAFAKAMADARRAAYERAAQECEAVADDMTGKEEVQAAHYLSKRIRALLDDAGRAT